jgi:hypothetical protein
MSFPYMATIVTASMLVISGCQSAQPVAYRGLESASALKPNPANNDENTPYAYRSNVRWSVYRNVIIEPVIIYRGQDNQFGKMSEEDKQVLARYMQAQFSKSLSARFAMVNTPSFGTLRIRLTLAGAKMATPIVGALTKFDLVGGSYNAIQAARGKEGMLSGSVNYAVEVHDAKTGRLLAAYVARQYPSALNVSTGWTSLDASMVGIQKGANELADQLR